MSNLTVVSINDKESGLDDNLVPGPRQVVDDIIAIWKEDPSTELMGGAKLHALVKKRHPNWQLLEKRTKGLLKEFGLSNNATEPVSYAKEIKAHPTPSDIEIPPLVRVTMTLKRGKGLFARKAIKKGEELWLESPLFFVPPLQNVQLMKMGQCCAYCGRNIETKTKDVIAKNLDCELCPMVWCLEKCKKANTLHSNLYHLSGKRLVDGEAFMQLEEYCLAELWNALYAIAMIQAQITMERKPGPGVLTKRQLFDLLALVGQDVRYKALNLGGGAFDLMSGGALFVEEQQETLWKLAYTRFAKVFPRLEGFDYQLFLQMLGTYNINNVDSNVFMLQLHMNHNCEPNVDVDSHSTDRTAAISVKAARDIRAGEELTTTYVNPSHTVHQRQRELRVNWGFVCGCERCKREKQEAQRRQSQSQSVQSKEDVRKMLSETKLDDEGGIELVVPTEQNGERRKLVRFDEKVLQLTEETENEAGTCKPEDIYGEGAKGNK